MAYQFNFNPVVKFKSGRTIDFRCILELLVLRAEYKPVVLGVISVMEATISAALLALNALNLNTEVLFKFAETSFKLVESSYNLLISEYNDLKNLVGGVPCIAFDEFFKNIEQKLAIPRSKYEDAKRKLLQYKRTYNLQVVLKSTLEFQKDFFNRLKEFINQLPDAEVSFAAVPAANVGPNAQQFTPATVFEINKYDEDDLSSEKRKQLTSGKYELVAEDIGKNGEATLLNITSKVDQSLDELKRLNGYKADVVYSQGQEVLIR